MHRRNSSGPSYLQGLGQKSWPSIIQGPPRDRKYWFHPKSRGYTSYFDLTSEFDSCRIKDLSSGSSLPSWTVVEGVLSCVECTNKHKLPSCEALASGWSV